VGGVFTKSGIGELHALTHERMTILLRHIESIPEHLHREPLPGFGFPTIWKQLIHIFSVEEGWVHDLQKKPFDSWSEREYSTFAKLWPAKARVQTATRTYLDSLDESRLNATLENPPQGWFGETRSPAFILLHVVTHTFHHKGQVVAMLRTLGHPAPDTDLQQ
jgi:uncharacterized damage-inducible protein DinB